MSRYVLYQDPGQWVAKNWWYWKAAGAADAKGHGPYPLKIVARVAAWFGAR